MANGHLRVRRGLASGVLVRWLQDCRAEIGKIPSVLDALR